MTDPISFSSTTPRHALPVLFVGQAQKEIYVNEALARIDLLLHTTVIGIVSTPPATPLEGACYIVGPSATGGWEGNEDNIAGWSGGQWTFVSAQMGMRVFDQNANQFRLYKGQWQFAQAPSLPNGGTVIDSQMRVAFAALIDALQEIGVFSEN